MEGQKPRQIIHLDLDAFFCAVEEQLDPSLRGKPFAVGGRPETRGVVASCSYAARKYGLRSAMPMAQALKLCPDLIIISHHHRAYSEKSRQVMAILHDITPLVEQISIDEAFLDVSDLPEPAADIARRLQARIRDELGLPSSLGVATNKLVAKIATNVGKAAAPEGVTPNAIRVVPPGAEAAFLAPLPIRMLWGVGPKTAARLIELGIHTIGDIARAPTELFEREFGKHGRDLAQRARGIDNSPVTTAHEAKSISREITFAHDVGDVHILYRTLRSLSESVGQRLRRAALAGTTIKLKLRWADFTTLTRQETLAQPTDQDSEIYATALRLLKANWQRDQFVRLIGVGVSGLRPPLRQLGLWERDWEKEHRLLETLDRLRGRFGEHAVQRGGLPSGEEKA